LTLKQESLERTFMSEEQTKIVRAACPHDCPDTCAMLVTVENNRAVHVAGDPAHPVTRGTLCTKD
jgi:anaerobic selenocysteine-containing dehydrogenase